MSPFDFRIICKSQGLLEVDVLSTNTIIYYLNKCFKGKVSHVKKYVLNECGRRGVLQPPVRGLYVASWVELVAKTLPDNTGRHKGPGFDPWVGEIPWSRKWHLTLVFLPGKFHVQRSLVGYSSWGGKEQDRTVGLS